MDNTVPTPNIATAMPQQSQVSTFLSLSPSQPEKAKGALCPQALAVSNIGTLLASTSADPSNIPPGVLGTPASMDGMDRTRRASNESDTTSVVMLEDKPRFLRLGHAQPGEVVVGDWAME